MLKYNSATIRKDQHPVQEKLEESQYRTSDEGRRIQELTSRFNIACSLTTSVHLYKNVKFKIEPDRQICRAGGFSKAQRLMCMWRVFRKGNGREHGDAFEKRRWEAG